MKIAILGAGLSGVKLAQLLSTKNYDVHVFEKSRGIGGRLSNKKLSWGNIDFGAQYFTARDNRFLSQVDSWLSEGVVDIWEFDPFKVIEGSLSRSSDQTIRYVGNPNMNSIAHSMASDFKIHFEKRVETISRVKKKWQLTINNDSEMAQNFDWVISSLPAEQSRCLFLDSSIIQHIPREVHLPCWAVALATKGRVDFDIQGVFGDQQVSWVSRQSSKPSWKKHNDFDDLWMVHFSSNWSELNESAPNEIIVSEAMSWLMKTFKDHMESDLKLINSKLHFWRYAQIYDSLKKQELIVDKDDGLAQVGAWLSGGRVEGAYLSAIDLFDYYF